MYISFGLALAIIALIAALLWAVTGWWITKDVIWAVVLFVPLAPTISLFARVLWIYLDQTFDPEPPGLSELRGKRTHCDSRIRRLGDTLPRDALGCR